MILIGAITLAFILLGIVVVFNGVLYTETISSSSTSQSTADAEVIEQGLERNLVEIAHRWNLDESGDTHPSDFDNEVIDSGGFRDQYQSTTARSRSAVVDIQVDDVDGAEQAGVITDQEINDDEIDLHNESVGHLELELGGADSTGTVTINATQKDGTYDKITLKETGRYELDGTSCEFNGPARVDLVTGEVNVSPYDCAGLDLITATDDYKYDTIEIEGSRFDGKYDLVAESSSVGTDVGVWEITADVTYESNQVSYERTDATIKVYGENG
ncbi:hypothetical protein C476_04345 [Natrinema limicola JCM 13563]|uniref:Uncharacterized protein n=1 Tax=Natrinema limicola JCM 13563 TaxID=1230457 RepID=M0CMU0_9EURY|nr:hypothetical protein C476_04345 [Natrinema limicola JCM 13563]